MSSMAGRDIYLRFGDGPVQEFRVWDAETFLKMRIEEGKHADKPYKVDVCTQEDYQQERRKS